MAKAGRPGLSRPRVHVKVDPDGAATTELVDLPFVIGVIGDFAGHSPRFNPDSEDYVELSSADRRFVEIREDNLNKVMEGMGTSLNYFVDDKLSDQSDRKVKVDLKFTSMESFLPDSVIAQVPQLAALLEKRNQLRDLLAEVDGSFRLETMLEKVLADLPKNTASAQGEQ